MAERRALKMHYSVFAGGGPDLVPEAEKRARLAGLEPTTHAPEIESYDLRDYSVTVVYLICQPKRPKAERPPRTPTGYLPTARLTHSARRHAGAM